VCIVDVSSVDFASYIPRACLSLQVRASQMRSRSSRAKEWAKLEAAGCRSKS
jgi:hypothetical protein